MESKEAHLLPADDDEKLPRISFAPSPPRARSPSPPASMETPEWTSRNEVVRDLHRAAEEQHVKRIPASKSHDTSTLARTFRIHPDVGTASDLAQPGGFRRAHIVASDDEASGILQGAAMQRGAFSHSGPSSAGARARRARRLRLATPLLETLEREGFFSEFITRAVERLADGTEVRYDSRAYRRGARPRIVRTASGEDLYPAERLRFFGFRPLSVPWWSSAAFLFGAILFSEGSFFWMAVGHDAAPAWAVTYPYFVGGLGFWSGCYLAFVEVINANLSEDLAAGALNPDGSIHRKAAAAATTTNATPLPEALLARHQPGYQPPRVSAVDPGALNLQPQPQPQLPAPLGVERVPTIGFESPESPYVEGGVLPDKDTQGRSVLKFFSRLHWWRYQPKSLLWWGALVQFIGATLFQVSLAADLPAIGLSQYGFWAEATWVYVPSLLGSFCFTFASYVYLLEVAVDADAPWLPPPTLRERMGFSSAWCNLVGSVLYTVSSAFYFAHPPPGEDELILEVAPLEWEYLANFWGVRFGFGVGSLLFVAGTLLAFPDILSD